MAQLHMLFMLYGLLNTWKETMSITFMDICCSKVQHLKSFVVVMCVGTILLQI
jgi:hypothetical protein